MEKNFTEVGINQWRKALEKSRIHQESDFHKNSFIRWQSFVQMEKDGSVLCKMSSLHSQTVADNREYLAKVVKVLIFLARQGVALRGDNEKDDSKNKGNFLELCSLVSDFDPSFSDQISKLAKNATYLSAQIQNELIGVTANVIRNQISSEIQEAGMATIIVDETKDCSKKEQMSICVRYVTFSEQTGHTVKEEFLQFREADGLDADSLCQQISKEIETLGLNNVSVVAQCYDGASVMSGHLSGVQTRFREKYPNAVYVHCYAHRLNLALVAVCGSVKSAGEFFALVESLYVFLSRSIVHKEFVEIQQSNEVRVKELVRLSDTRWSCRYQSLSTMKSRFKCIVEVLEFFSNASVNYSSPTLAVEAKGLLCQVLSVSFITHLEILTDLLSHSHCLSEMLQKSDLNLASAEVLVRSVIDSLDEKREKGWTELWKFINLQCDECDIHVPETLKPSGKRKRVANRAFQDSIVMTSTGQRDQPEEYSEFVRVHTYLELLDRFKAELERRFLVEQFGPDERCRFTVKVLFAYVSDYNVISKFIATYSDTLDIDADLLKAELAIAAKIPIKTNQVRDHQEFRSSRENNSIQDTTNITQSC